MVIFFKVLGHVLTEMDGDTQLIPGVVKDDLVELAPVAVKDWGLGVGLGRPLVKHNITSVPLVNTETIFAQIDTEFPQTVGNLAWITTPAVEDAASVGTE